MIQHHDGRGEASNRSGPDPVLAPALEILDPATRDPTYWFRFHGRVMAVAARELARRRMLADLTVSDLVVSWARGLVSTAVLAAAVAAFLLLQGSPAPTLVPLGLEEQLAQGLEGAPIPLVLTSDDQPDIAGAIFASEAY